MQRVLTTVTLLGLLVATAGAFAITEHLKLEKSPLFAIQVSPGSAPEVHRGVPTVISPICNCPTRVAKIADGNTDAVLALYRQMHPGMTPAELLIEITTDSNFWVRSVLLAERKAAKGKAPIYMYSFNWQTPVLDGKLMAPHALDVPFVFDTLDAVGITGHSPAA